MNEVKTVQKQPYGRCKVVGISSYEKDGKKSYNLHLVGYFNDYNVEQGAVGLEVQKEWTRLDVGFLRIGDVVELQYTKGFQDKAVLANIKVIKDARDLPFGDDSIYVQSQDDNPFSGKAGKNA